MLADWLVRWAQRRPVYRKGHLFNRDGSAYMLRFHVFESKWLSIRVHHIQTADEQVQMHDHPWSFVSVLLKGGYVELRPLCTDPCFYDNEGQSQEWGVHTVRTKRFDVCFRRPTDRHRIGSVLGVGAWTLFITGPVRQWWGFYTPEGKVFWRQFLARQEQGKNGPNLPLF